jgi:hypothetical protein
MTNNVKLVDVESIKGNLDSIDKELGRALLASVRTFEPLACMMRDRIMQAVDALERIQEQLGEVLDLDAIADPGTAQGLTCANCGEVSTNPGQFEPDGRWVCTQACRNELRSERSYNDLRDSGGIFHQAPEAAIDRADHQRAEAKHNWTTEEIMAREG